MQVPTKPPRLPGEKRAVIGPGPPCLSCNFSPALQQWPRGLSWDESSADLTWESPQPGSAWREISPGQRLPFDISPPALGCGTRQSVGNSPWGSTHNKVF
ncbi:phosphatidylinositol 4-kinase beta [Platysternon megacephalum]|uniref:Phosphatidylinositol 4-kinase beta n=1 Tax=Platysternon megacephalum TaxID=55544 RepID=A0A4D9DKD7_9SAUR|nr:phosphatidylinositol 4-kinase beta [Platysternon megacephalum]